MESLAMSRAFLVCMLMRELQAPISIQRIIEVMICFYAGASLQLVSLPVHNANTYSKLSIILAH
jgi:hypothetical protein